MNQQTRDYGLRTPVNGDYLQTEFQGIYENFNNLDDTIGELTALRERIKSAIPPEALDLITAVNKIDEWLQTHTDNVSNPHNVGMSQLTNYSANNKIENLTAGTVSTDALNKGQLDSAVNTINTALSGKSNTGHGHSIADVSNLQSVLDSKSAVSHNHSGTYQPVGDYLTAASVEGKLNNGTGTAGLVLRSYSVPAGISTILLADIPNFFAYAGAMGYPSHYTTTDYFVVAKGNNRLFLRTLQNAPAPTINSAEVFILYWATP